MFRTISVAAIAAIWATSASAAPVHFDNKFGIANALAAPGIIRGVPAHGLRNQSAFASMQSMAAKKIAAMMVSGGPTIPPLVSGGGSNSGGGAVAVPTVMPLPGGIVLLAGGLGFLLMGVGMRGRRKIA